MKKSRIYVHPDFKRMLKKLACDESPDISMIEFTGRLAKRKKNGQKFNVFW